MLSKEDLSNKYSYPAYSSDSTNNGIIGYTNKPEFICNEENPVFVTFGDHTRTMNIARKSFSVLDNVKVLKPIFTTNEKLLLFVFSIWKKKIPNLGYARHWKLAKDCLLQLPITSTGKIDFAFMENFISELEEERISELSAYLEVTGLKDYTLTPEEENALKDFEKMEWGEFEIGDLFDFLTSKKRFDANKVKILENGNFPYIVRTSLNNGTKGYLNENEEYLNSGNTISFGQDTATIFYQKEPYFTGDKIKIVKAKDDLFNAKNALYFLTSMNKSFQVYSWGSSSFNVDILSKEKMFLPLQNNSPNYTFMETFIKAVKKLVIKDVVLYADKKSTQQKT